MSFSTESSDVNTTVASSDAQQNKSADGSIRGSITTSHAALVLDRKKTATIWTYCVLASNKTTDHTDSVGRPIWICKPCSDKKVSKFFLVSGGTASMYRHLRKFHQINPPGATKQINTATLNTLKNCKDWTDMDRLVDGTVQYSTATYTVLQYSTAGGVLSVLYCTAITWYDRVCKANRGRVEGRGPPA
jgi:hypothetical protein